jgi:hypothetical protein
MPIRDPKEELHDTLLYKTLANLSSDLASRIDAFITKIAPILATTIQHFPYYTRHDAHHGYRVIKRIEQILTRDCFEPGSVKSLTATELFLLIASAYSHDLGMTVLPGEEDQLTKALSIPLDAGWQTNRVLQGHLRKNHSKRGGEYLFHNARDLQIPVNIVGQLDWLMKSHNMSIPELDTALSKPFAAEERVIDVRQLAIILCIADAIEFSDTRVIDGVLELISKDPSDSARQSYLENMKHVCVGDSLAVESDGRIVVSGTFDDPEVLSLAHHTFDQIEEWTRGYCDIERRSAARRLRIRPEPIQRRLELRGGRFERLGIRINKKNIIDLISSNAIWKSDSGLVIRELLQNSVEACRYRRFHSSPADKYEPKVTIRFERTNGTFTVQDNGCGMSERVVLSHFLTVGNSRAKEKTYLSENYAPIARFGIGFWSVFTIAESATVQTLAFEDARGSSASSTARGISFQVELKELKDYTIFSDHDMLPGTTITLHLRSDVVIDELFDRARNQLLCSEIPVEFHIDSDVVTTPKSLKEISDEELLGAKKNRMAEFGIETFHWQRELNNVELQLCLAYRINSGPPSFLDATGAPLLHGLQGGMRWPSVGICGFRGNFFNAVAGGLCFDLPRVGTFHVNHRSPLGFEYSIDRQGLISNRTSEAFSRTIVSLVHSGYRSFLGKVGALDPKSIFQLNTESRTGGGNVFDTFTETELVGAYGNYPDLVCFKLIEVAPGVPFANAKVRYMNVTDLATQKGTAWVIQNGFSRPMGGLRFSYIQAEGLVPVAYQHAQNQLSQKPDQSAFVLEPDRSASMLFDSDPKSSVEFASIAGVHDAPVCIQRMKLENVRFATPPEGILAKVQGRWTGTIYVREFVTPEGRPYVFLGRHRVLVQDTSPLKLHLDNLKSRGQLIRIADTIAHLKDDEAGFRPDALSGLL